MYQGTHLVYLTKKNSLVFYNLNELALLDFKIPANPKEDSLRFEIELGATKAQTFEFRPKFLQNDRILVLLTDGSIVKYYFGNKVAKKVVTVPDSLKQFCKMTDMIQLDKSMILSCFNSQSKSNTFILLSKSLDIVNRLTINDQSSMS